jgi:hypothetical protein
MKRYLIAAACMFLAAPAIAQPPARIADLAWMVGSWEGEGIGGAPAAEAYSAPSDGKMIGHFRQLKADGTTMFYELILIEEVNGSLRYNVKHFNPDLTGWEEKGEVRRFPLSDASADKWSFSGVSYERTGDNAMTASVIVKGDNDSQEKLDFHFRR